MIKMSGNKSEIVPKRMVVKVKEVVRETFDSVTVYFINPHNIIQYKPGQFLTITASFNGEKISRPYSFCTSPYGDTLPAITVKKVPNGMMSGYLVDTLQPGDQLEVYGPQGSFTTDIASGNKRHLVMFGGCSGITPLMSIARSVLHIEADSKVTLVYANRSLDTIIFKNLLLTMQQVYKGRFMVMHMIEFMEDFPLRDMARGFQYLPGRLNAELTENLVCNLADYHNPSNQYFICGPEGMIEVVREGLNKMRIPEQSVQMERFRTTMVEPPINLPDKGESRAGIYFESKHYTIMVPAHQTILTAAAEQGLTLPSSCRGALCGTCRAKLRSGQVALDQNYALTDEELAQGYVLTCVGRPTTPNVMLEYE